MATGCDQPLGAPTVPTDVVAPTTVGMIAKSEQRDDGILLTLENGETVVLPPDATDLTGQPNDGELVIVGTGGPAESSSGVWFAAVRAYSSGCFELTANGEVRGDRMATSFGFSLPLSEDWSETDRSFVNLPPVGFCLDESGEVVGTYPGSDSRDG
jgi:hypothetical protein